MSMVTISGKMFSGKDTLADLLARHYWLRTT